MEEKISLLNIFHLSIKDGVFNNWPAFSQDFKSGSGMLEHSLKNNFARLKADPKNILQKKDVVLQEDDLKVIISEVGSTKIKLYTFKCPQPLEVGNDFFIAITLQEKPQFFSLELDKSENNQDVFTLRKWENVNDFVTISDFSLPDQNEFINKVIEYINQHPQSDNKNLSKVKSWDTSKKIKLLTELTELGNKRLIYIENQTKIYFKPEDFIAIFKENYLRVRTSQKPTGYENYVQEVEKLVSENLTTNDEASIESLSNLAKENTGIKPGYDLRDFINTLILEGKVVIIDHRNNKPVEFINYYNAGSIAGPLAGSGSSKITFPDGFILKESSWIA